MMNNSANSAILRQWCTILQKRLTSVHITVDEVSLPVFGDNLWLGYIWAHQWMLYGAERCPLVGGLKRMSSMVICLL